jgi:hypothetical protein
MCGTPHEHLPTPEPSCRRGGRRPSRVARPAQNIRICVATPTVRRADGTDQNGGSRAAAPRLPVTFRHGSLAASGSTDDRRLPMSRMLLRVPGGLRRGSPAHPRVTLGVQRLREDRTGPACCGPVVGSGISGEVDMDDGHGRDPAGPGQLPGRDGGAYTDTGAPWPGPAGRRTGRETAGVSLWSRRSNAWWQSRRGSSSSAPGAPAAGRPGTAGRGNQGRRRLAGGRARALRRDRHDVRAPVRTGTGIRSARAAGRTWPG